jgi:transcription elongation factor S-II
LQETKIGISCNKLTKHSNSALASSAQALVNKWRDLVKSDAKPKPTSTPAASEPVAPKIELPSPTSASTPVASSSSAKPAASTPAASAPASSATPKSSAVANAALKESSTGHPDRDKMQGLLLDILRSGEISPNSTDPVVVAVGLEKGMFDKFTNTLQAYREKYRELAGFLRDPKNPLRVDLLSGAVEPEKVANMSEADLCSEEQRQKRAEIQAWVSGITRSDNELMKGTPTNEYRCKCGKRECVYYEKQTRSADEPMTIFIMCVHCKNKWRH